MFSRLVVSQVKHNSYFLAGLAIGLWISLAVIPLDEEPAPCTNVATEPYADDYEPVREERPMEGRGAASAGSLKRPRYYSTELGMRGSLLAAALAGSGDSDARAAALNATASRLQPALKFFITARGPRPSPGAPNVIAFTDTREMLKPFHTLKYLADNYLEEFDFFFLVSDSSYVNTRRLTELVSKLSVSQDVYMGTVAEDDSHYCSLDGGILLSNSVLRSIHSSLDWCVRNSYSAHHHENLGRCILHAAHLSCMQELQGQRYDSAHMSEGVALQPELADAVTVHPLAEPRDFHHVHTYVSRVYLERARVDYLQLGAELGAAGDKLWPRGLRVEQPLAPPNITRFDHLRWTWFNSTHEMMPDDHHSTAPLSTVHRKALDLILDEVTAWLAHRYDTTDVELLEGARVWEPTSALRYKLWLKVGPNRVLKGVEAVRVLGAARLAPARYVTESSPLTVILPTSQAAASAVALRRLAALVLPRRANVRLIVVLFRSEKDEEATTTLKSTITELNQKYPDGQLDLTELPPNDPLTLLSRGQSGLGGKIVGERIRDLETRAAAVASRKMYGSDTLLLFISDDADFNEDFLNRVRMNTLSGEQWFLPAGFARYSQYNHPLFVDANGRKPQVHTGRFNAQHTHVLAAYARDVDNALTEWSSSNGSATANLASILAASHLRCILAPEPSLQLAPRPAPCMRNPREPCLNAYRDNGFKDLDLGAKHELAKLLLQVQANI